MKCAHCDLDAGHNGPHIEDPDDAADDAFWMNAPMGPFPSKLEAEVQRLREENARLQQIEKAARDFMAEFDTIRHDGDDEQEGEYCHTCFVAFPLKVALGLALDASVPIGGSKGKEP